MKKKLSNYFLSELIKYHKHYLRNQALCKTINKIQNINIIIYFNTIKRYAYAYLIHNSCVTMRTLKSILKNDTARHIYLTNELSTHEYRVH